MPIYEYECGACREVFEKLVGADRGDRVDCPACGSRSVSRLWSVFSPAAGAGATRNATCADICGSHASAGCAGGNCPMKEAGLS